LARRMDSTQRGGRRKNNENHRNVRRKWAKGGNLASKRSKEGSCEGGGHPTVVPREGVGKGFLKNEELGMRKVCGGGSEQRQALEGRKTRSEGTECT